ncbi:MAG: YhfC family glutamic-type intramembrane protease [Bacteroidota bacterium]
MLSASYILSFSLMIVLPILLGIWITRKLHLRWTLLLAGAVTFIASQVLHIPLVLWLTASFKNGTLPAPPPAWSLVFNAVLLGLLAGLFEETARWILFRFILKRARTWEEGVMVGVGHGGIEAVLIGASAAAAFFTMLGYRAIDLSTVPTIPPEQLELARQQVAAYWASPAWLPLIAPLERAFAICLHLSLSVMVLYSLAARKPVWFWLAVLWHAVVDGVAVYIAGRLGVIAAEVAVGLMAAASLWILFALRPRFGPGFESKTPAPGAHLPLQAVPGSAGVNTDEQDDRIEEAQSL